MSSIVTDPWVILEYGSEGDRNVRIECVEDGDSDTDW